MKSTGKMISVLLAEDHLIVREGLRVLINAEPDLEVVGEVGDGRMAVEQSLKIQPQVVVLDIAMPLLNGLEAARQIIRINPGVKIILLSAHSDDAYITHAIALGAAGYLVKQSAGHCLTTAIRTVADGGKFFSPIIAKRLADRKPKSSARAGQSIQSSLTSREMEVLQLIAEGKANKQTADELQISAKTVEKHRHSLMQKLGIHDTAGLTRYAIASGVIRVSPSGEPL